MTDLFREMDRHWDHDGRSPAARAAMARWAEHDPGLRRFDSPADLVAAAHNRHDVAAGASVDWLTEQAPTDPWAARTVLQAVMPALVRLARKNADMVGDAPEPFATTDELDQFVLCAAFEAVTHIAARVAKHRLHRLVDATWSRLRHHARMHRREQRMLLPLNADASAAPPSRSEVEELAILLVDAVERRVLRPLDAGLVYTTRVAGHTPADVADALQWRLPTLWRRRNRTETVLAAEALGLPRPSCCVRSA